jgi:hypothetical protein
LQGLVARTVALTVDGCERITDPLVLYIHLFERTQYDFNWAVQFICDCSAVEAFNVEFLNVV